MPILNKDDKNELRKYNDYIKQKDESYFAQDLDCYNKHDLDNYEGVYIEKNGNITAAITYRVYKLGKKSVMLVADGGPVCDIYDVKLVKRLIDETKTLQDKYKIVSIKIYPYILKDEKLIDLYKKEKFKFSKNTISRCILKLSDKSIENISLDFTKKTNYIIERANKKGIVIKAEMTKRALDKYSELYKSRNVVKIEDVSRFEHYKSLMKNIQHEYIRVFTAYYNKKIICSAIVINYNKQVICVDEEYNVCEHTDQARALMHMQIIEWGVKTAANKYDMGSMENRSEETIRLFKGFLGTSEQTNYLEFIELPFKGYYINKIGGICIGRNNKKTKNVWTRTFN